MIDKTMEILQKFNERYFKKYHVDLGKIDKVKFDYDSLIRQDWRVSVHINIDDYWLHIYLDEKTDELVILNMYAEDITTYAEERGWTEADVFWIKFGKIKDVEHLPDRFQFKSNINPLGEVYEAQKTENGYTVTWNNGNAMATYSEEEMWQYIKCGDFAILG